MRRLSPLSLTLFLGLFPAAAHADSFTFSYVGYGIDMSGTLDAADQGNGQYLVQDMQGSRNGVTIAQLENVGAFGGNDNLLYLASDQHVSFSGISYHTIDGALYNLYETSGIARETLSGLDDGSPVTIDVQPSSSSTPEPSSLILLTTGVIGAAGLAWSRAQQA